MTGIVKTAACVIAACGLAAGAAGCATSTAEPPPPPPRLTQAQFVARATALCRRFRPTNRAFERRFAAAVRSRDFEGYSLLLGELVQPVRRFVFQLSRLRPPVRREHAFRELIRLANRELAYLRAAYRVSGTYGLAELSALVKRSRKVGARADALARSLGLPADCP